MGRPLVVAVLRARALRLPALALAATIAPPPGESKEKAARIANSGSRSRTARKGGRAGRYEDPSKEGLLQKARQVGIEGRSKLSKGELISALRNQ